MRLRQGPVLTDSILQVRYTLHKKMDTSTSDRTGEDPPPRLTWGPGTWGPWGDGVTCSTVTGEVQPLTTNSLSVVKGGREMVKRKSKNKTKQNN